MTDTLKEALETLLGATSSQVLTATHDDVHFSWFPSEVLNFDRRKDRSLTRTDVVRIAVAELGYDVVDEWLPTQGVSWLSGGISVGVSFRIEKRS